MTEVHHLIESLARNGVELHISFVPKHQTRPEYNKDYFQVVDWNRPSERYHSDTLAGALELLHAARVGPADFRGIMSTECFNCNAQLGALWRDDDYNGTCVDCYKRDTRERYSNRV